MSEALYPPEPISSTCIPGRGSACSSIAAWIADADTALNAAPSGPRLVTTDLLAAYASRGPASETNCPR